MSQRKAIPWPFEVWCRPVSGHQLRWTPTTFIRLSQKTALHKHSTRTYVSNKRSQCETNKGERVKGYLRPACGSLLLIGTIQRRLAWPLRKDDTQNREAFHLFLTTIFFKLITFCLIYFSRWGSNWHPRHFSATALSYKFHSPTDCATGEQCHWWVVFHLYFLMINLSLKAALDGYLAFSAT